MTTKSTEHRTLEVFDNKCAPLVTSTHARQHGARPLAQLPVWCWHAGRCQKLPSLCQFENFFQRFSRERKQHIFS